MLIIDKGNNPGGRLSTRNHPLFSFDHGAQFFTTKDSEFNELVQTGAKNKEIAIFDHPQKGPVYVGNPIFKSFISTLVSPFNIVQNALVTKIKKKEEKGTRGWCISIENSKPIYANNVILTMPAPQTHAILPEFLTELRQTTLKAEYQPCIAILAGIQLSYDSALILNKNRSTFEPILLAKRNISWSIGKWSHGEKNNTSYFSIIIHASPKFSLKNIERNLNQLSHELWGEWKSIISESNKLNISALPEQISYLEGHKWRFARVSKIADESHMRTNIHHSIALAGDWLSGPRIESAWISGRNAAISLLEK